jgi:hypothetical protein
MDLKRLAGRPLNRSGAACCLVLLLGCISLRAENRPKSLRLLGRAPLAEGRSPAMDIRWASDGSVYVARARDGVLELALNGTRLRQAVPDVKTFGRFERFERLAVSPRALAFASAGWYMAWRPRQAEPGGRVVFNRKGIGITEDIDLWGDRLLLLGIAEHGETFAPKGDVAWTGTLSSNLEDLKPVLYDDAGPGAPNFFKCRSHETGAVRFLGDGSFVIVPGFQKGVHLFAANGERVRSWTSEQLGLDTDCSTLTAEEETQLLRDPGAWQRWLNSHHVVDDILPLPQGPGLLVRSLGRDGQPHWELKVLSRERVTTYSVPVVGRRPLDRLHGDVRDGRIVLLLSASGFSVSPDSADYTGEILLAAVPNP